MRKFAFVACCLLVAFSAGAVSGFAAQAGSAASEPLVVEPQATSEPENWGTAQEAAAVVHATEMMPPSNTVGFNISVANGIAVFETTAAGDWWGEVYLPSGALPLRVQLEACDTDAVSQILFGLARGVAPGASAANITPVGATGASPGCAFFSVNVTTPVAVNNAGTNLHLFLNYGSTSNTNRVIAFRVFYRLQVSPAPATATFPNDVPTSHPFFRFIEALAASGVTGGCGPGAYCPDAAITRGQMAVFLASALGMHFAP
jgi:hypothetical protein